MSTLVVGYHQVLALIVADQNFAHKLNLLKCIISDGFCSLIFTVVIRHDYDYDVDSAAERKCVVISNSL